MQLRATCNIEQSFFNDWFSGHLNFQIEHHLFPTMPRHNYHLVAPRVRALCEKHGIPYQMKTMWQGLTDIVRSLKNSGDLWLDAYLHKDLTVDPAAFFLTHRLQLFFVKRKQLGSCQDP
ncbi:hypothetical protein INR49_010872 [Caranx melampygus]|nr:hypothetical protein INR49_010872 [Caranx melampygus]